MIVHTASRDGTDLRFMLTDCSCALDPPAPCVDGTLPRIANDDGTAARLFALAGDQPYSGVHLRGLHIVNIFVNGEALRFVGEPPQV